MRVGPLRQRQEFRRVTHINAAPMPLIRDEATPLQIGQHAPGNRLAPPVRQDRQFLVCRPHHSFAVGQGEVREDISHASARIRQREQVVSILDTPAGGGEGVKGDRWVRQQEGNKVAARDAVDDGLLSQRSGDSCRQKGGIDPCQAADLPTVKQGDRDFLAVIQVTIQAHDARREDEDGIERVVGLPEDVTVTEDLTATDSGEGDEYALGNLAKERGAAQRRGRHPSPVGPSLYW